MKRIAGKYQVYCVWVAVVVAVMGGACTGNPVSGAGGMPDYGPVTRSGLPAVSTPRLDFELVPGPEYARKMGFFIFGYTVYPQVAVWLETEDGSYLGTVYVTDRVGKGKFRAAPAEGRPEALPVWSAIVAAESTRPDAVSSPTVVKANVGHASDIVASLPAGRYVVRLETNRSYDWNGTYTRENAGVNGQPSLVYEARFECGGPQVEVPFVPVGTGSVDGSDGIVHPGLDGMDSALGLFTSLSMRYIP